ncbi:dopamine receptor 1-like [Octopus vulgaris]|uniref:Dopamine receptor 1-like n=1 Tax=Octopus vulgaris TaxID=6645 RepID=A0AA36BDA2_OCTVU|nr:dopamine receptor 1-like [Octopus vulgaris]
MCVVNLPFAVYDDLHKWSLGQRFCEAWVLMDVTLSCISALVIVMMNIDRLMFVLDAKRYVKNMKLAPTHSIESALRVPLNGVKKAICRKSDM